MGARAPVLVSALTVGALALSGCQGTIAIGAVSRCDAPVEVDVVRFAEDADVDPEWTTIHPSDRSGVRAVGEHADSVYVMVRRAGDQTQENRTIAITKLAEPPADADYDKEIELTGALCPPAAES
ncbi:hypothetical protein [Georgenia deserti]|uniref:Lipoprotein n=1 Tax=Georgenia deserti TaxID=2093781 RepID=A0ABW4L765_9MICO